MTKLSAVLHQAAPAALAGMPSWASVETEAGNSKNGLDSPEGSERSERDSPAVAAPVRGSGGENSEAAAVPAAADTGGSLARELRQKVFELEAQVTELQVELTESREMVRRVVVGGAADDGHGEKKKIRGFSLCARDKVFLLFFLSCCTRCVKEFFLFLLLLAVVW